MRMITAIVLSVIAGSAAAASPNEALEQAFSGIVKECNSYAAIVNDAHWAVIEDKLQKKNKALPNPDDFKESMLNLHARQCVIVQSIGVLRELESALPGQEWEASGGAQSIQSLEAELKKTIDALSI